METPAHSNSALLKNRLQEYTQKVGKPYPVYHTPNEGTEHAPMFRSTVEINGTKYTSPNVFSHRKSAEMDAARIALQDLVPQISKRICSLGQDSLEQKDIFICKWILNEYAIKMNAGKPIYKIISGDFFSRFVSSVEFNGKKYVGDEGRNIKESRQLAARAAILSILDSDARTVVSKANELKDVVLNENMPRAAIPEHCAGHSASVSAEHVPLSASHVEGLEANGSPTIFVTHNSEQPVDSKSTKKRKWRVETAAVPSSQHTKCTVAQSVPNNCVSLQGFDNAVLFGPCVLPKKGSGSKTYSPLYWRKPPEGFIALNIHGTLQSGIAAGGGVLRNHCGEHLSNFYNNYGRGSIHFAESKAILDGLSLCKKLGSYNKIQIQTDSAQAALWFHPQLTIPVPSDLQTIWNEIHKYRDTLSIEILHVQKEGNKFAEFLSKKGILAEGMGSISISLTPDDMEMAYLRNLEK